MPEWIVFQELANEEVLDHPLPVAAMVVLADDEEGAIQTATTSMAFMPGSVMGVAQIDDRKSYEDISAPDLKEKKKPKK
jgi:hypothetical protein